MGAIHVGLNEKGAHVFAQENTQVSDSGIGSVKSIKSYCANFSTLQDIILLQSYQLALRLV